LISVVGACGGYGASFLLVLVCKIALFVRRVEVAFVVPSNLSTAAELSKGDAEVETSTAVPEMPSEPPIIPPPAYDEVMEENHPAPDTRKQPEEQAAPEEPSVFPERFPAVPALSESFREVLSENARIEQQLKDLREQQKQLQLFSQKVQSYKPKPTRKTHRIPRTHRQQIPIEQPAAAQPSVQSYKPKPTRNTHHIPPRQQIPIQQPDAQPSVPDDNIMMSQSAAVPVKKPEEDLTTQLKTHLENFLNNSKTEDSSPDFGLGLDNFARTSGTEG
jgi:hypothetical protein